MALSVRGLVLLVLMIASAGAVAYRAGYLSPVTLFAEHAVPVYPQPANQDTIHLVDVTAPAAAPSPLTSTNGANIPAGWAADGSLLYLSDRIGRSSLYAQAAGSDVATLVTDYPGMTGHARATPDGAAVLFTVAPSLLSRSHRIMRVALHGGEPAEVVSGTFIDGGARCAVAPAMLCTIAEWHDDGRHVIFSALNPVSGRGRELARVDGEDFRELHWDLSPDGTRIAVADARGSKVRILLIGGPAAEQIRISQAHGLGPVRFTHDSRGVIVPAITATGVTLWSISLRGDAALLWEQPGSIGVAGIPSRNGKHVAVWVRTRPISSSP